MIKVDKRSSIYELEEIYKYKSLIERADRDVIKQIIYNDDDRSTILYDRFLFLVAEEVDHKLNKPEFYELKNKLVVEMKQYLESK